MSIQNSCRKFWKNFRTSYCVLTNLSHATFGNREGSYKGSTTWFLEMNRGVLIPDNLVWTYLLPKKKHEPGIAHTKKTASVMNTNKILIPEVLFEHN